jgi:hypothetical protein
MEYTNKIKEYLSGEDFSNGAIVNLESKRESIINRDDFLLEISKNKNILHLGFVDHLPLIDKKIEQNNWLHQKLIDSSHICCGIDINKEGIKYIQDRYKIKNLYRVNIISDKIPKEILDIKFDYLLIPDVIEHIGNPVEFLEIIREKFKNNVDRVILTTPNAFRWNNFLNTFKGVEVINSDHRFWFTPFTLSKILTDSGYTIYQQGYFEHGKFSRREIFKKFTLNKYPLLRDTLIIEVGLL